MPGLWIETDNCWMVFPLDNRPGSASAEAPAGLAALLERLRPHRGAFLLTPSATRNPVLLAGSESGAFVNGNALPLGIRVLRDKDEIFLTRHRTRLYYTAGSPATIALFEATDTPTLCPRCTREITAGGPSVQCPTCGLWYHQTEERPCWTYTDTCRDCAQRTDLDGGYSWTPEGL